MRRIDCYHCDWYCQGSFWDELVELFRRHCEEHLTEMQDRGTLEP